VGFICQPALESIVSAATPVIGYVEIEPQVSWIPARGIASVLDSGPVRAVQQAGLPVLIHSVGAPIGGTERPPRVHTALLARLVRELAPRWVSEHLSILRAPHGQTMRSTGVLIAPLQTPAGVRVAADNLARLSDTIEAPVAFETGVNYLRPRAGEMPDAEFFAAVAEAADCGVLLDLHNLWCNERNGRDPAIDVIDALPPSRVWEIHVAAGYQHGGHYLDAHSGITGKQVMTLLDRSLPSLPNLQAVTFEVSPDRVGRDGLSYETIVDHLEQLALRCRVPLSDTLPTRPAQSLVPQLAAREAHDEVSRWEVALSELVSGREPSSPLAAELARDDGHTVWRDIASASRRGQFAGALPLTCRLLLLTLGEAATLDLLQECWAVAPPGETSVEEAAAVAAHLRSSAKHVEFLDDVLTYELDLHRWAADPDGDHRIHVAREVEDLLARLTRGYLAEHHAPTRSATRT
jgi:uncharacterized protein